MSFKLAKERFLYSMKVGMCNTQIGGFSPILTKKLTPPPKKKKIGDKINRFFLVGHHWPIFLVIDNSFGVTYAYVNGA